MTARIRHTTDRRSGFTLVEALLAMALMSAFMIVLTSIFTSVLAVQTESQATSSVAQDGRFLLARLSYDIQRADDIVTPAPLGGAGGRLTLSIGGENHTYEVIDGSLTLDNDSGTAVLNGSGTTVSGLSVQKLGNSGGTETVRLSFTVNSQARDNAGPRSQTFTTTVGLR